MGTLDFTFDAAGSPMSAQPAFELPSIGLMPAYEDIFSGPLPPIASIISRAPVEWWLDMCSRFLALFTHARSNPQYVEDYLRREIFKAAFQEHIQRRFAANGYNRDFRSLYPFPVAIVAEIAGALAISTSASSSAPDEPLQLIMQAIYCVHSHINRTLEADSNSMAGAVAAITERSNWQAPHTLFYLAFSLWLWNHDEVTSTTRAARSRFDALLRSNYGIGLQDFLRAAFLGSSVLQFCNDPECNLATPQLVRFPIPNLTKEAHKLLFATLSACSTPLAGFQAECRAQNENYALLKSPSLLPIKKYPCVRGALESDPFLVLSRYHLAEAAIERPIRLAESVGGSNAKNWRGQFGGIVEDAVHGAFRTAFSCRYIRLERSEGEKRADGLILYPDGVIIVECKSTRVREAERYTSRTNREYSDELKRGQLRKATEQILQTANWLMRDGQRLTGGMRLRTIGSIVVFLQELPLTAAARSVMDEFFWDDRTLGEATLLRPQVLQFHDIFDVESFASENLLELLMRKQRDHEWKYESLRSYCLIARQLKPNQAKVHLLTKVAISDPLSAWLINRS